MRRSRILSVMVVAILFVAVPNVSAKVCHPKAPITCDAAELSRPATPPPAPVTKPAAKAEKIESPAKPQQAMVCGPWIRWCRANTLV